MWSLLGHGWLVFAYCFHVSWLAIYTLPSLGCPLCDPIARTISDDLGDSAIAVTGRIVAQRTKAAGEFYTAWQMEVVDRLKGQVFLDERPILEVYAQDQLEVGSLVFVMAFEQAAPQWTSPLPLTAFSREYLRKISEVRRGSIPRLRAVRPYLDADDTLVAEDAYNEFARASLEELWQLRDSLDPAWICQKLKSRQTQDSRRALYWMLLSLVGTAEDVRLFDSLAAPPSINAHQPWLSAAIACYILVGGEPALTRIELDFFDRDCSPQPARCAALNALRVVGNESSKISRERLTWSFRKLLKDPELAEFVISDLARLECWEAMDELVALFHQASEDTFVRVPIFQFLRVCPEQQAKQHLAALEAIDPVAAERSSRLWGMAYSGGEKNTRY
jgi:hypothetical protein